MLHQHSVQLAARATAAKHASRGSAARSSRIQETFLTSAVSWRGLKGRSPGLSVDFSHVAHRPRWSGPEAAGLLPNAAAKVGDGASSVSRALAKQNDESPLCRNGGLCRLRVVMDECG